MKTITYFVPVDFSECSYNALQYAIILARFSEAKVKLWHVIDLGKVPESDNPVVVSFALSRLTKKAEEKMKSLTEMISMEGVSGEGEIAIGNVRLELMKQIDGAKPHVIVFGKNVDGQPDTDSMLSYITQKTKVPVLVVPRSHNPKIPSRIVLATDIKPSKVAEFEPFFNVIKKISQGVSILNVNGHVSTIGQDAQQWLEKLNSTYGINAHFLDYENYDTAHGVADFIRTNNVDLLCTVKRNYSLFDKLFKRKVSNQLAAQADVPVLLLNE
jgi:hypothetical protein